jgi:hypothetical protein
MKLKLITLCLSILSATTVVAHRQSILSVLLRRLTVIDSTQERVSEVGSAQPPHVKASARMVGMKSLPQTIIPRPRITDAFILARTKMKSPLLTAMGSDVIVSLDGRSYVRRTATMIESRKRPAWLGGSEHFYSGHHS